MSLSTPSFSYVGKVLSNKPTGSNLLGPHVAEGCSIAPYLRKVSRKRTTVLSREYASCTTRHTCGYKITGAP